MNYLNRKAHDTCIQGSDVSLGQAILGANMLIGSDVRDTRAQKLGYIREIMLNMYGGGVSYVVLSFGGFLGIREKLFAVPWSALNFDPRNQGPILNLEKNYLTSISGFDKNDWPDIADQSLLQDAVYHGMTHPRNSGL